MHDAVRLEAAGKPTAVIVTTEFVHEAHVQREALGMIDLEPVVVTHPLSTLSAEQLDERARQAFDQVAKAWS
ncbi:MAG: hypothetical protein JO101_03665 [Candidatus Eremiobacteraeota bacterium]|nr:hypothetical protein [Candidatus Eremiobacteraeota bacterium]MBV8354391.1 hypothetical protein [Candidatus Eremiobacteraeota bacterium]